MGSGITVKKLFQGLDVEIKGNKDFVLSGICAHSKFVAPGNLFIAKKGESFDATQFIPEAAAIGAGAVFTDLYNPFLEGPVQVIHPDPAALEAEIAGRYFGFPSKELFLVGITGTNGKTTTAYLIHHLLGTKEAPCGLMGTIETLIGKQRIPSQLTTADVVTNQKFLREMRDQGATCAVMEATSHALDQGRVEGIDFDVALFTNFSQDHLDYHGTMERYLQAKAKLFEDVPLAIVNRDDPASADVLKHSRADVLTFGVHNSADFVASEISSSLDGTTFTLTHAEKKLRFKTPLIGAFNVLNVLAALAVGHVRDLSFQQMQRKIATFPGVPGRLERIANPQGIHLFVDFAHTEEALTNVLSVLQKVKKKNILTLFGCGGDRDRDKRPKMGRAVEKFSDQIIVTSDNPRTEDPEAICHEVVKGMQRSHNVQIEVNRKVAIQKAIASAQKEDIVLIAGRGHEPFQKIGGRLIPFDDREVARDICNHSI